MPDTLLLIDVQPEWTDRNPSVTARIAAALPLLRDHMDVVWVYNDREWAERHPGSVLRGRLPGNFNLAARMAAPRKDERVFFKSEQDAFTNPSLAPYLLNRDCSNIYLAGFLASCCVMSTAAGAPPGIKPHVFENLSGDSFDEFPIGRRELFLKQNIALASALGLEKKPRFAYPVPA